VLAPFVNSDHCQVNFNFIIAIEKSDVPMSEAVVEKTMHLWQDADFVSMTQFLNHVDWYLLLTVNFTANSLWHAFTAVLQQAVDMFMPCQRLTKAVKRSCKTSYPRKIKIALWRECNVFGANARLIRILLCFITRTSKQRFDVMT